MCIFRTSFVSFFKFFGGFFSVSWETLKIFSHDLDTCFCYYSSITKILHWIIPWLAYCDNLTHIFRNVSQLLGSFPILFCVLYYQKNNKQNKKTQRYCRIFCEEGWGTPLLHKALIWPSWLLFFAQECWFFNFLA